MIGIVITVTSALLFIALVILIIWLLEQQFLRGRTLSKEILKLEGGELNLKSEELNRLNRSVRRTVKLIGANVFLLLLSWLALIVFEIGDGGRRSWIFGIALITLLLLELGGFGIWIWRRGRKERTPYANAKTAVTKEPEKQKEVYSASSAPKKRGGALRLLLTTAILVAVLVVLVGVVSKLYPKDWPLGNLAVKAAEYFPEKPQLVFPGYEKRLPDEDEPQDHSNDPSDHFAVFLQSGGYHGPITIPPRWGNYQVTLSRNPGDWMSVWCYGRPAPGPIHPYYEDVDRDFMYCGAAPVQGTWTSRFFLQGHGILTLRATTYKW